MNEIFEKIIQKTKTKNVALRCTFRLFLCFVSFGFIITGFFDTGQEFHSFLLGCCWAIFVFTLFSVFYYIWMCEQIILYLLRKHEFDNDEGDNDEDED